MRSIVEVGWLVRKPRKITPLNLLNAIYENSDQGLTSYNNVASTIDSNDRNGPARQAVAKRMNKECQQLLKLLIEKAFEHKLTSALAETPEEFLNDYNRVVGAGQHNYQASQWAL